MTIRESNRAHAIISTDAFSALVKSWRGLNETEVRKITQIACKEWASNLRQEGGVGLAGTRHE